MKDFFVSELSRHLSLFSCLFSSVSSFTSELKSGSLNLAHQSVTGIAVPSHEKRIDDVSVGWGRKQQLFPRSGAFPDFANSFCEY